MTVKSVVMIPAIAVGEIEASDAEFSPGNVVWAGRPFGRAGIVLALSFPILDLISSDALPNESSGAQG